MASPERPADSRQDWRTPRRENMERSIASLERHRESLKMELKRVERELRWKRVHVRVYLGGPSSV